MAKRKRNAQICESVDIVKDMSDSYLAYSMSVLLSRAIPDYRTGMKPIQQKILYAMAHDLKLRPDARYAKSTHTTGTVMAKYSPHGDSYGSLVNLAQKFKNNHPLVDGHGNFGSPTDNPASARYTEAKLTAYSWECLLQNLDAVDTKPNYDSSSTEPIYLAVKVPNLLVTPSAGIGVGFSTNLPPHNLRELSKALNAVVLEKSKSTQEKYLTPDFPSECDIVEDEGLKAYKSTGRGSIRMRAKCEEGVEERSGRKKNYITLTFTNIPFGTSTEKIGSQLAKSLDSGQITSPLVEVVDQSDRSGDRIVLKFKHTVDSHLAKLEAYRFSDLDSKFSANSTAIYNMKPEEKSPSEFLRVWFDWRVNQFVKELNLELSTIDDRLKILNGLLKALENIDTVISIIRESSDRKQAHAKLKKSLKLNDLQVSAILELKLHRLTSLDQIELEKEAKKLKQRSSEIKLLKSSPEKLRDYILDEVESLAKRHGNKRRCDIIAIPESLTTKVNSINRGSGRITKIRYLSIDKKTGVLSREKYGKNSDIAIGSKDKFLVVTKSGKLAKFSGNQKEGPLFANPEQIIFLESVSKLSESYMCIWEDSNEMRAMSLSGSDLTKTTSKGKDLINASNPRVLIFDSSKKAKFRKAPKKGQRKKEITVLHEELRKGKPGQKGIKLANSSDIQLD